MPTAVSPSEIINEGPAMIITDAVIDGGTGGTEGSADYEGKRIACHVARLRFDGVDASDSDTWDSRVDVSANNTSNNGPRILRCAASGASGEDVAVNFTVTDESGGTGAYSTVTFTGAESDWDGELTIWYV